MYIKLQSQCHHLILTLLANMKEIILVRVNVLLMSFEFESFASNLRGYKIDYGLY